MICYESVVKIIVDKPKNNIVNILELYAFTKQKTKKKKTQKVKQTIITVAKLL